MQNEGSLVDRLLKEKENRPAQDVFGGVSDWFKSTFGSSLPVKNLGASDFERKAGWEHSRSFDVGLHPSSAQGQQLISYLNSQGIPFSAFSGAVKRDGKTIATGPHIHVGPPSHAIGSEEATTAPTSLVEKLLAEKAGGVATAPIDNSRGAYMARANAARNAPNPLETLAHNIEWHFGYGTLVAFPTLPEDKQRKIAELATQYAAADEIKKKHGVQLQPSPAWKLHNQKLVGAVEGIDFAARTPPEVDAAQRAAFSAGANPLLRMPKAARVVFETLATGGAGLVNLGAGLSDVFKASSGQGFHSELGEKLRKGTREYAEMTKEAQAVDPFGRAARVGMGVGSGLIEFAPLMLIPELGLESVLARIGASAVTGGVYSGVQARGRGENVKGVIKEATVGGATFGLLGMPLPGKRFLTKALSGLAIVGGGTTVINLATGQPLEEAATQGLVLSLMRGGPALWKRLRVKAPDGTLRPATPVEIKGLLGSARFELETAKPKEVSPQTVSLPARQSGRAAQPESGQGELFSVARPGETAGRADAPGFHPEVLTLEQWASGKGLDPTTKLAQTMYEEYRAKVQETAGSAANAPPEYVQWGREADAAQAAWEKQKVGTTVSAKTERTVQEAIAEARANGPSPEFRAFFGGIEPRLASTTIARVQAFAKKLGIKFEPSDAWIRAEKDAPPFVPSPAPSATGPSRGGLGPAPEGAEAPAEPTGPRTQVQQRVGGPPQPQQNLFTFAGPAGERVPIFDSRTESPNAALVRLERLRLDPDVWNNLSPADRASIGKSIADLKAGKSPAQILDEAALSQQGPGIIRMSEETARNNLKTLRELKADEPTWNRLKPEEKAAIEAQIKRLEEQGAGELPPVPTETAPSNERTRSRWTTREQLEASPEKLRLMKREQQEPAVSLVDRLVAEKAESKPETLAQNRGRFNELKARLNTPPPRAPWEGQEGAALLDTISLGIVRKLNTIRNTVATLVRSRGVRDALAYSRDAGDNQARIFGEQMKKDVEGPLREAFGTTGVGYNLTRAVGGAAQKSLPRVVGEALSFVIESKGDPAQLAVMRNKIVTSTKAAPGWKARALAAIDFAQANYARMRPMADRYKAITDAQIAQEQAAGLNVLKRDGYVMHAQDIEGDTDVGLLTPGAGSGESTAFRKVRQHETFADSISAGVNPKSLNSLDLLSARVARGQQNLNRAAWAQDIKAMTDNRTGRPVAVDPVTVTRADGTTYQEAPQGYHLQDAGLGQQKIAIHNGYEGIYSALTRPSEWQQDAGSRFLMTANGTGKSISLMLDTFHLGRLAFWESLIKALGVRTFKIPIPSYRKGVTLLDMTVPEIQRMAANGEIPPQWTNGLVENKRRIDLLVKHGYNVGGISDMLHQEWIHAVPLIGNFNKWLFTQFQRGAMTEIGLLEFERRRGARPTESEAVTARAVAKDLNTRFGNLGRQGVFKSRTAQDRMRLLALAPQWNEGLIRSELGAVTQAGKFVGDVAQGKRIYAGVLLRSVGAMAVGQFAANQLINLYTRGHPTWDNPEEGWGAKVSAYIPDKISGGPGFFLHPMGLAAETTHLLLKGFERTGEFSQTLNDYARSRASSAMRPVLTFITRRDYLGRVLKPGTVWSETVKSAIPTPIPYRALSGGVKEILTGKPGEQFPGEYQKQIMSSFGIRTESVSSGEQRIRKLAAEFNEKHGLERQGEFYDSPYQPLTQSLSKTGGARELSELITYHMKNDFTSFAEAKKKVREYYENRVDRPITGNKEREKEFVKELNPEQRSQYEKIKERRMKERDTVRELMKRVILPQSPNPSSRQGSSASSSPSP